MRQQRLQVCFECQDFNGNICELAYPNGCCLTEWANYLDNAECPKNKWGKNENDSDSNSGNTVSNP